MNFCSNCGTSDLKFKIPEGDTRMRYHCETCNTIHYQNPKIVVGCLPIYEDKLLLCRRNIEPRKGYWNLPAGFMENNETVEEGAKREVWEEVCAEVILDRLFIVFNILPVNQVYMIFLAQLPNLNFSAGDETLEARLFAPHEIPFDELAFQSNHFTLHKYLENPNYQGIHIGETTEKY